MDEYSSLQGIGDGKMTTNFNLMKLIELIIPPFMMFLIVEGMFTFVYSENHLIVWVTVAICAGMAFFMVCLPNKRPEGPMFHMQVGLLCLIATGAGAIAGFYNWDRNMSRYDGLEGQRTYHNVLPAEPALAHLDAGKIYFSSDSKPNLANAVGYKDGSMYCVAPVVDSQSGTKNKGEFFAAGVDCCKATGPSSSSFNCGAARDPQAHGGLVYLDNHLVAKFRKAAERAAAAHGTAVSKDALFVEWVREPNKAANALQNTGITFFLSTSAVYLSMSILAGFFAHNTTRRRIGKVQM